MLFLIHTCETSTISLQRLPPGGHQYPASKLVIAIVLHQRDGGNCWFIAIWDHTCALALLGCTHVMNIWTAPKWHSCFTRIVQRIEVQQDLKILFSGHEVSCHMFLLYSLPATIRALPRLSSKPTSTHTQSQYKIHACICINNMVLCTSLGFRKRNICISLLRTHTHK